MSAPPPTGNSNRGYLFNPNEYAERLKKIVVALFGKSMTPQYKNYLRFIFDGHVSHCNSPLWQALIELMGVPPTGVGEDAELQRTFEILGHSSSSF